MLIYVLSASPAALMAHSSKQGERIGLAETFEGVSMHYQILC